MKLGPVMSGVLDIMRDFAPWTSTHAVPHIFMADTLIISIFWTIIFFAALGMAIWQFYTVIAKYLSFPIQMDARIVSGIQPFPAVTFCNANPWKLSKVAGTPLEGLVQAYSAGQASTQYGFDSPFTQREVLRAQRWTTLMFEQLKWADQNQSANIGYSLNDLLIDCTISRAPCDLKMVSSFYDAFYGHCHIFNLNTEVNVSRSGPNYGLRLQLRSIQSDYLPWVETAGVVFYAHRQDETPFEDVFGYLSDIGRTTSVGIKYYERTKLGRPYDTCVKTTDKVTNYYSGAYQVEACVRTCLQDQIIKECGCYDPSYNTPSDTSATSCYEASDINTAIDCIENIIDPSPDVNTTSTFSIASDCKCDLSCNMSYYDVAMSQGLWPAKTYTPIECYNVTLGLWSNVSECWQWYRNNTLSLLIYYERTDWETDIESQAYDIISMIADTGGQIGLWLGMSVVSVLEFFVLFAILIAYIIIKPKRPDLKGFDYWAQFDKLIEENRNDDDPDLIYGDSDEEKDGPSMPPKPAEANKTMRVTDLGDGKAANGDGKEEPAKEEPTKPEEPKPDPVKDSTDKKEEAGPPPKPDEAQQVDKPAEAEKK